MDKHDELIGVHPTKPNIFGRWLNGNNHPAKEFQCHRSLTENEPVPGEDLVEWLAERVIFYHYSEKQLDRLKAKYGKLGFQEYANNIRMVPKSDKTRKGNLTEIILAEYIINSTKKSLIKTYRFRYSTNVDQSMKGDDMLMVDYDEKSNEIEIYLGEAKFRKTPTSQVIKEIVKSLDKNTIPLSYTFLTERLFESEDTEEIAEILDQFIVETVKRQNKVTYSGLLLSNRDCPKRVQNNLHSENDKLVFLSIGIEDPHDLVEKVFTKVDEKLANPVK